MHLACVRRRIRDPRCAPGVSGLAGGFGAYQGPAAPRAPGQPHRRQRAAAARCCRRGSVTMIRPSAWAGCERHDLGTCPPQAVEHKTAMLSECMSKRMPSMCEGLLRAACCSVSCFAQSHISLLPTSQGAHTLLDFIVAISWHSACLLWNYRQQAQTRMQRAIHSITCRHGHCRPTGRTAAHTLPSKILILHKHVGHVMAPNTH
jgi:hypothetical protein